MSFHYSNFVNGRSLNTEEQEFVSVLIKELERFQLGAPKDRFLSYSLLFTFNFLNNVIM